MIGEWWKREAVKYFHKGYGCLRKRSARSKERAGGSFWRKNKKRIMLLVVTAIVLIVAGVLVNTFMNKKDFDASSLAKSDVIRIGIRTDIKEFGSLNEQGELIGYDREYVDAVLQELFGKDQKLYDYISITSQDAGAMLKYDEADICLGLLTAGVPKTKGFQLTDPYYMDKAVAVLRGDSRVDKLQNISGGKVGVLTTAISFDSVEKFMKDKNISFTELLKYSDYESIMSDLQNNKVDAVVVPGSIARVFEKAGYRILAESLYEIGYSMMLPTSQTAAANEINRIIHQFEEDGTAQRLREKWGV